MLFCSIFLAGLFHANAGTRIDRSTYESFIGKIDVVKDDIKNAQKISDLRQILSRFEGVRKEMDGRSMVGDDENAAKLYHYLDRLEDKLKQLIQSQQDRVEKHKIDQKTYEVYFKRIEDLYAEGRKNTCLVDWERSAGNFRKFRKEMKNIPILHGDPRGARLYAILDKADGFIRVQMILAYQEKIRAVVARGKKVNSVAGLKVVGRDIALLRNRMKSHGIGHDVLEEKELYDNLYLFDAFLNRAIVGNRQVAMSAPDGP